jgi:hypothetical protein
MEKQITKKNQKIKKIKKSKKSRDTYGNEPPEALCPALPRRIKLGVVDALDRLVGVRVPRFRGPGVGWGCQTNRKTKQKK